MTDLYVASKAYYGSQWRYWRDRWKPHGINVVSSWIDESEEGQTDDYSDLWVRCVKEASECDILVAYHAGDEVWKGAFLEVGAALGNNRLIIVIGRPPGTWLAHPNVVHGVSIGQVPDLVELLKDRLG